MKKLEAVVFDIDGTLTGSKLPLDIEMAELICRLLGKYKVGIISGASFKQFQWQILDCLKCQPDNLDNLYFLPVDGTVFCRHRDGWQCENDTPLPEEDKNNIKIAFTDIFEKSDLEKPEKVYGELVEDRGAQLNFSALGQEAPIELKEKWDPDSKKRKKIIETLERLLPDFSMRVGGTTSIEVTKVGIDKAYGLKKFMTRVEVTKEQILYIGDKLFEGGNDAPVLTLGIECRAVRGLEETKKVIIGLLA